MIRRPTIKDLAKEAGLGVATVDRVLHGRPNVSRRAMTSVAEAADRLGYPVGGLLFRQSSPPVVRLGFVLHKPTQRFYQEFARRIEEAAAERTDVEVRTQIRFSPSQSPGDFAAELRRVADRAQAVAASAINHPDLVRLSEELSERGIPTFSLLNDFARGAGAGYFGIDNLKAGRLAAWMIATKLQRCGRVAVFVGGNRWTGHALRETGFRTYLREHAPEIQVMDTLVNLETRQVTYEATLDLMHRHLDLAGVYVAGGGMEGAIAALRETRPPDKVALVVNELTDESRSALSDRYALMVIATPLKDLCKRLIDRMISVCSQPDATRAGVSFFEPDLYLPESF